MTIKIKNTVINTDRFIYATIGATAVQVGAANLKDPYVCKNIIEQLPLEMERLGIERLSDIIGIVK